MKILAKEKLSEHKYKTPEGYLICVDSVLARTGKQTYTRDELFHDGDETEIEVDRTPEEVFSDATLASFENKPLVVEHPDEDVNSSNIQQYAVGFVRDVKRGELDGEPVMLGTLVITDEQTIKEIEDGEHTDLSCGYDCDIQDEAKPSQKNIRGNHVALCQTGRAGIARIVDSVKDMDKTTAMKTIEKMLEDPRYGRRSYDDILYLNKEALAKIREIALSAGLTQKDLASIDRWVFGKGTGYQIVDSVEDGIKLPNDIRKDLSRILAHKSTFTKRDVDVLDLIKELERYFRIDGKKVTFTREGIKGWYRTGDGTLRKDYKFSVDGYDNSDFMISLYADEDYKTTEINAYMLDSIKDSKFEEYMRKLAYIDEYWQVSKMLERAYNELGLDEYKRLREAGEKRKKEILAMHDSIKDDRELPYHEDATYCYTDNLGKEIEVTRWRSNQYLVTGGKENFNEKSMSEYQISQYLRNCNARFSRVINEGNIDDSNTSDKLIESGSEKAFKKNIATEIRAGKDPKQAVAIAYSVQRENDSDVEDKLIDPPENIMRDFENELKRNNIKVVGKGKTLMGRNHYQVEFGGKDYELHKIFTQISSKLGRVEIPMTWAIGVDKRGVTTAGVDLDKQYVKDDDTVEDAFSDVPNWFKSLMLEAKNKIGLRSIGAIVTYIKQNSKIDEDTAREWYMQCYSKLGLPAWEKEAWRDAEDAMEKYYIRWIDQYSKSKGYDKSFWLYDDEVKANSAKEALDKLANIAVMRGVGTRYATIVNIKTDKTSYQVSGNIDDLRKRQLDSMASTYEKATKGLKEQLNNVGDSCKVGKYKVTKIK